MLTPTARRVLIATALTLCITFTLALAVSSSSGSASAHFEGWFAGTPAHADHLSLSSATLPAGAAIVGSQVGSWRVTAARVLGVVPSTHAYRPSSTHSQALWLGVGRPLGATAMRGVPPRGPPSLVA